MSFEEPLILLQIIFIDIVMAADNAIIIGLVAAAYSSADSALTALTTSFCLSLIHI